MGDWIPITGEDGRTYYHNNSTQETAWELPANAALAAHHDWRELMDEGSQRLYYHNAATGETVWVKPTGHYVKITPYAGATPAPVAAKPAAPTPGAKKPKPIPGGGKPKPKPPIPGGGKPKPGAKPAPKPGDKPAPKPVPKPKPKPEAPSSPKPGPPSSPKPKPQPQPKPTPAEPTAPKPRPVSVAGMAAQLGSQQDKRRSTMGGVDAVTPGQAVQPRSQSMNALPEGWTAATDPASQKTYYYNAGTGETSWTKPTAAPPTAPQGAPPPLPATGPPAVGGAGGGAPGGGGAKRKAPISAIKMDEHGMCLPKEVQDEIHNFSMSDYAEKHFNVQKSGKVFRKAVCGADLLNYTPEPLSEPLTAVPKSRKKEALNGFKLIMQYMGDLKAKTDKQGTATQLLGLALSFPEIIDELYCQAIKQTTNNPSRESETLGWQVHTLLVQTVPPTKDFENYVLSFYASIVRESSATAEIKTVAAFCTRKLPRTARKALPEKPPADIEPLLREVTQPCYFGSSIDDILLYQRTKNPSLKVPDFVTKLCQSIMDLGGCTTVGIFRVPGDAQAIQTMRQSIIDGGYQCPGQDANLPAGVLKLWMRELEEPVIPPNKYTDFVNYAKRMDPKIWDLVNALPEPNANLIYHMIEFLNTIATPENAAVTKMNDENCAMVFGPNFLRCPFTDPGMLMQATKYEKDVVLLLMRTL